MDRPFDKEGFINGMIDQAARDVEKNKLLLIRNVLREYIAQGKTIEDFEKEYGCALIYEEISGGINGVRFHNDSNETMFMLKYDK
jgi:hypothetical protein